MKPKKDLKIGALRLESPFIAAPLAGITDAPTRLLCREMGASLTYSEMISGKGLMIMAHQWWGNIRELRNCIEFLISLDRENVDSRDVEELLKTYPNRKDAYKLYDHQPGVREDAAPGHGGAVISGDEMLVLGILADGFEQGRRLGRRSISALAKDRGVFLGEQQVRTILQNLARDGYAVIGKGKAGTVITASGMILDTKWDEPIPAPFSWPEISQN